MKYRSTVSLLIRLLQEFHRTVSLPAESMDPRDF